MEQRGFIHDKLEIKFLTLFILGRLAEPIDPDTLTELTLSCDGGISYFAFSECIAELTETEHLTEENGRVSITEKGLRNGRATESSIPHSVRRRAEQKTAALARLQRRDAMIKAESKPRHDDGFTVTLALSDGLGNILEMNLYAANETQAAAMEAGFTQRAEQIYGQIISLLMDGEA